METVIFASPRCTELAADPTVRPWLALSSELVLVMDGRALRITTLGAETDSPLFPATPARRVSPLSRPVPYADRNRPSPHPERGMLPALFALADIPAMAEENLGD